MLAGVFVSTGAPIPSSGSSMQCVWNPKELANLLAGYSEDASRR
jgi:hypothetical protein